MTTAATLEPLRSALPCLPLAVNANSDAESDQAAQAHQPYLLHPITAKKEFATAQGSAQWIRQRWSLTRWILIGRTRR